MNYLNLLPFFYKEVFSWDDLMFFTLISCVLTPVLISYYNWLDKKINNRSDNLKEFTHNSIDVLKQENIYSSKFVSTNKKASVFTKIIVYSLAFFMITISMTKILRITDFI